MSVPFISTFSVENAHKGDIYSLQACPRYTIAASGDGFISAWDNNSPSEELVSLNQQPIRSGVHHLGVDPGGSFVVAIAFDASIVAFSLRSHTELRIPTITKALENQGSWACAVAGSVACISTLKGSIFVVDLSQDTVVCELKEPSRTGRSASGTYQPCLAVDISADRQFVVGSYESGRTRVFSVETRRMAYSLPSHITRPRSVRFNPTATLVAITGDKSIALFSLSGGSYLGSLVGHDDYVYDIAFESNGERLMSVAGDGKAKVWSLATSECVFTLTDADSPLFACTWIPERSNVIAGSTAGFATAGVDQSIRWYREASGSSNEFSG